MMNSVHRSEGDIRRSLSYRPWQCGLCGVSFFALRDARSHFEPEFARHPGQPFDVSEVIHPEKERQVRRLLDEGQGLGAQAAEASHDPPSNKAPDELTTRPIVPTQNKAEKSDGKTVAQLRDAGEEDSDKSVAEDEDEEEPEYEETKPLSTKKGSQRSACKKCGRLVTSKSKNQWQHATDVHAAQKRFLCRECGQATMRKSALRRHCARRHPGRELRGLVAQRPLAQEELSKLLSECFDQMAPKAGTPMPKTEPAQPPADDNLDGREGEAGKASRKRPQCRECSQSVRWKGVLEHTAVHHLKEDMTVCAFNGCPASSKRWNDGVRRMKRHVEAVHKAAGTGALAPVDRRPLHRESLYRLAHHLFPHLRPLSPPT